MSELIKRPTDPYDPAWVQFRAQNPGIRLSLSAADAGEGGEGGDGDTATPETPVAPDLSFIPDTFKAEDGSYKLDDFKSHFDELASFKAQSDERAAALPQEPDGYEWGVGEDFAWAEGFDPSDNQVPVLDDDGKPVIGADGKPETRDMTPADMINPDDPDLGLLQSALHKHGADPALMKELAGIMANREVRGLIKAGETAAAEKKALGPNAQSRMDQVERNLNARLPAASANAIFQDITTADALRGLEILINSAKAPPSAAPGGVNLDNLSNKELIAMGMKS